MTIGALARSEATKLLTARSTWILGLASILGTLPMAWANAASGAGVAPDDPRLFSSIPVPLAYQGFELAGFGYVLVVALGALWAGSEFGSGGQLRTTLLATPRRLRLFAVKTVLLAAVTAVIAFVTLTGAIVITHLAGKTGVNPWMLTPAIWSNIGGATLAITLVTLLAFAIGSLARSAILPLVIVIPMVIGLGDLLSTLWEGARFLPVAAGAGLYSDPTTGFSLGPLAGALALGAWTLGLLAIAGAVFVRRDA